MIDEEVGGGSLTELRDALAAGDVRAEELTERALARAEAVGRHLNAFTAIDREGALAAARRADAALARGDAPGLLHGVPLSVKDLIRTRGLPTTCGSRALGDGLPGDRDAEAVRRLRAAGAILVGKTSLNEFAYGITGDNHHFGSTLNPWDAGRMPGGSSSGSAAAVAAGIGAASVGTDTRGSVRIPAACCGVTGFKPTRGRISTDGVFPLSWTLDHVGPLTRSVADAALVLEAMTGGPPPDPGSGSRPSGGGSGRGPRAGTDAAEPALEGLRLGLCDYFFADVDPEVEAAVREAVDVLAGLGMELVEVEVPELDAALRASGVIAAAEALAVHDERIRTRRRDYGPDVLARLEKGYELSALDLARAHRARLELIEAYGRAFREVDAMAGPTLPGLPAPVGATVMRVGGGREEWVVKASCRLTSPQNMTGAPALSVPCGFSESGLPVGLQLWAASGNDALVLAVGRRYQRATDWHRRRPPAP